MATVESLTADVAALTAALETLTTAVDTNTAGIATAVTSTDDFWLIFGGCLVFFMQTGFAMLEGK